jgi:hypothetical protein
MLRYAFLSPLLILGFELGQAQFTSTGPPASALSPTADGRLHGIPASALSLKPVPPGVNVPGRVFVSTAPHRPFRPFDPHHRRRVVVPVPLFYPVYGGDYASQSIADPNVVEASDPQQQADEDAATASSEAALRQAYLEGAHDALRRELDAAQRKPPAPSAEAPHQKPAEETQAPRESRDSPATVFIFKDGHQLETKNYAIMGQTLYDLSSSNVKKVPLNDLDSSATLKANDDRGIQVKLP